MSDTPDTRGAAFQEFAGQWFQNLVKGTASVYNGGKAVDAVQLSPDEELRLWLKPTSPAATRAYELGGSDDDATKANQLWAHVQKGRQEQIRQYAQQQGASPDQVEQFLVQNNLTDEQIFKESRLHAYNLGKQNGKNSPAEEVAYHDRMAKRAAAQQPSSVPDVAYQTVNTESEAP